MLNAYLRQIWLHTAYSLRARYRGTLIGLVWVIINPLALYGIQSLVFKHFLKLDIKNYYLFLLSGLLPWIFISMCLQMCTPIFEDQRAIIKSFKMNPVVLLIAMIADNLVNFIIPFLLLISLLPFFDQEISLQGLLFLPLAVALLLLAIFPLCWLLATLQVFFRDTRYIVGFALSFLFFLTPIFYPKSYVPEKYQFLVDFNPIYHILHPFKASLYSFDGLQSLVDPTLMALLVATIFWIIALVTWRHKRNEFYLHI